MMTIDEFRATGRDVADLSTIEHIACSGIESGAGRTYMDDQLFIEHGEISGAWHLTLGNAQLLGSLADMERKLYDWAVSEGYIA